MKRRILAWVLAVCAALTLVLPAAAATTRFSDVSDPTIRQSAEVLRLMGVLDGYADGTFRPGYRFEPGTVLQDGGLRHERLQ